jgi:hypothetical protein
MEVLRHGARDMKGAHLLLSLSSVVLHPSNIPTAPRRRVGKEGVSVEISILSPPPLSMASHVH